MSRNETERWYEFTQVEILPRAYFVRARTLREARAMVRGRGGLSCGVPDYAPDGPEMIKVIGPGRLADQEIAEDLAGERGRG